MKALPESTTKRTKVRPDQVFQRGKWHLMSRGQVYVGCDPADPDSTVFVHITADGTRFVENLTHAQKIAEDFEESMKRVADRIKVNSKWLINNIERLRKETDEDD